MNEFIYSFIISLFCTHSHKTSRIFSSFVSLLFFVAHVQSLYFNFSGFDENSKQNINYQNDALPANGAIQLTKISPDYHQSVGRASYNKPMRLWDKNTNETTNFTTHFSFNITQDAPDHFGDGLTFFLAPFDDSTASAPDSSAGTCLGLVGGEHISRACSRISKYEFVAVEFDTFHEPQWDPGNATAGPNTTDHIGIDVTSVVSDAYFLWSGGLMKNGTTAHSWITYDSSSKNLSVYLTYDTHPVFNGEPSVFYVIDLKSILPELVRVGFTSATGNNYEFHSILSWELNSTLKDSPPQGNSTLEGRPPEGKWALVGGLVAGISIVIVGIGSVVFIWWRRRSSGNSSGIDFDMDGKFDQDTGPRRFTYNELIRATSNFPEEGKLGQGGFGGVYKGYLTDINREIAVKKISKGSKQGIKEYMSEVKIISRLRHRNLVQLLGWCHERGELLLVYEFMPNGSLDTHLYAGMKKVALPWATKYKIVQDLASALLYLHQDWEQCVLHRDIKPSNVMLDSAFNSKLGDFGLARLVDHNIGAQTTDLAGTLGYLAPECVITGQASKESDVYSFGVVALEVACGRRPVETIDNVSMSEWVWNLYGEGHLLEAVDKSLGGEFDVQQVESLLVVGLWCCHPDHTYRPSIRQALNVLNMESALPSLPLKYPVPIYCFPSTNMDTFYITSSSGFTGSSGATGSSSRPVISDGSSPLLSENAVLKSD